MASSVVALVACESYDPAVVLASLRRGLDLLGGAARFVKAGERILLKPNVLYGTNPDRAVTTHPALMRAMALLLREAADCRLYYGDSSMAGTRNLVRAGLAAVAEETGVALGDFEHGVTVPWPAGMVRQQYPLVRAVRDADAVISLCKLKTHGLTRCTGAVKNQFGCVHGFSKGRFHALYPRVEDFCAMLVDVCACVGPRLYVMDAVVAMEGNGPGSGEPRKLGVLLLSTDPVALDATACRMIALDPGILLTNTAGERAGLGTWRQERIDVVGDPLERFIDKDFDIVRAPFARPRASGRSRFIQNLLLPRPVIDARRCVRCGRCVAVCPVDPKALQSPITSQRSPSRRPPRYNYDRCIRCFCCQEGCPEKAIRIKQPLLANLLALASQAKHAAGQAGAFAGRK